MMKNSSLESLILQKGKSFSPIPEVTIANFAGTPVYLFNEHQWALYSWLHAKENRIITKKATLLHIDAHSDMGEPLDIPEGKYTSTKIIPYLRNNNIDCGSFILPAVYRGLMRYVDNIYWIVPSWKPCAVASEWDDRPRTPSTNNWGNAVLVDNIYSQHLLPLPRPLILDIDLDYFATMNLNNPNPKAKIGEEVNSYLIDKRIKTLFAHLKQVNIKPNIVTIAESDQDNMYTPHHLVDYIRRGVIKQLLWMLST